LTGNKCDPESKLGGMLVDQFIEEETKGVHSLVIQWRYLLEEWGNIFSELVEVSLSDYSLDFGNQLRVYAYSPPFFSSGQIKRLPKRVAKRGG
jgi:hypothetical protein